MQTHTHESYSGSTFNTLNVQATGVSTVTLESVELGDNEWISLIEVSCCCPRCSPVALAFVAFETSCEFC